MDRFARGVPYADRVLRVDWSAPHVPRLRLVGGAPIPEAERRVPPCVVALVPDAPSPPGARRADSKAGAR